MTTELSVCPAMHGYILYAGGLKYVFTDRRKLLNAIASFIQTPEQINQELLKEINSEKSEGYKLTDKDIFNEFFST